MVNKNYEELLIGDVFLVNDDIRNRVLKLTANHVVPRDLIILPKELEGVDVCTDSFTTIEKERLKPKFIRCYYLDKNDEEKIADIYNADMTIKNMLTEMGKRGIGVMNIDGIEGIYD